MKRIVLLLGVCAAIALGACGETDEPAQEQTREAAEGLDGGPRAAGTQNAGAPAPRLGPQIAFTRDGETGEMFPEIYVMSPDGSNQTKVADSPRAADEGPSWSPDGQRIAFTRWEGKDSDIHVMNVDGSDQVRLTDNPGFDGAPAWSPDGERIAFASEGGHANAKGGLYVMNADGTGMTRLARGGSPSWSPDGEKLAFSANPRAIYRINADGTGRTKLTGGPDFEGTYVCCPAFSPDGERIAFLGLWEGTRKYAVSVMKGDGTNPTPLTSPPMEAFGSPAWSPDGERIAFAGSRPAHRGELHGIYVMNADGTDPRRLPDTQGNDGDPAWSAAASKADVD